MKHLFLVLFTFILVQMLSCSAGLFNSPAQLYGSWVSQLYSPGRFNYQDNYYSEFIFKKDSFFIETVRMDDDLDQSYLPFKAKGTYTLTGDRINCKGVYKPERAEKFNYPYEEEFEYSYDSRILALRSLSNPYQRIYSLIKRYPDGH